MLGLLDGVLRNTDSDISLPQGDYLQIQLATPPWWEHAPEPVAVLVVPSLHFAPIRTQLEGVAGAGSSSRVSQPRKNRIRRTTVICFIARLQWFILEEKFLYAIWKGPLKIENSQGIHLMVQRRM
jgi:hypothetical protein